MPQFSVLTRESVSTNNQLLFDNLQKGLGFVIIGDKIISNYFHAITQIAVDFPAAPALKTDVEA